MSQLGLIEYATNPHTGGNRLKLYQRVQGTLTDGATNKTHMWYNKPSKRAPPVKHSYAWYNKLSQMALQAVKLYILSA